MKCGRAFGKWDTKCRVAAAGVFGTLIGYTCECTQGSPEVVVDPNRGFGIQLAC